MGLAMSTGGGSVVTMGNGNTSDYAVHSQIIGSGNILIGTANTPSINNTINGYGNTGRNVERMSMMGTGNNISGSTADVVIGDYHHMDGGKNNVILGSMATEKKTVEKTYTMKDASGNVILEKKYKVTENVPIKSHTANISNAVMLGYNTDVEKDGGVAIGADSIASVDKGAAGYDPSTDTVSADTSATWKATAAAVSVGKAATPTSAAITRQITNVAAGTQDTDAVNVAQLKKVEATAAAAKTNVTAGDNVTVTHDSTTNTYKVSAKDTYTTGGTYDAATKKIKFTQNDPSKNYEVDVSGLVGSGGTGNLTFAGDTGSAITKNSGETLQITGGATEVAAANNIGVVSENGKLNLKLAKNIDLGSDGSIKTGDTKMDNKGLAIEGGPSVTKGGIDAGSKKITHVAAGEISATSTDAVNGSQLQAVKNDVQNNTQNIYNMGKKVGELGTRINKVGAGAAALAALHPLDFDPHDKWDIAAGFGNYRNASAAAVGLFYRPNERTMMSLGWTMGDDRNMLNAGISVKLGRGDVYTRYSKVEMANQIKDLKEKNDKMQAENKEMRSELDELKAQVAALAAKK